jgi:signal transduction histidine kinase
MRLQAMGRLDVADQLVQLVEIRHALHVDLMATLSHLATAHDEYLVARQLAREGDHAGALSLMFEEATFRKSLARSRLAGDEMMRLFEDARVLLSDIRKRDLKLSSVNIALIVNELRELFAPECNRRNVSIEFSPEYPPSVGFPVCDRQLIRLAIFNLIENAIKYSHRNSRVVVKWWIDKSRWKFSVSNQGKFIPREGAEELFIPFKRGQVHEGEQVMGGTGLGLPTVKKIVEVHSDDGLVELVSIPIDRDQKGNRVLRAFTTFTLTMPRHISGSDDHG